MCFVSSVTCPLSLTPTATVKHPPPAKLPRYAQLTGLLIPKNRNYLQNSPLYSKLLKKKLLFLISNISVTLFNQKSLVHREAWFTGGDKQTDRQKSI